MQRHRGEEIDAEMSVRSVDVCDQRVVGRRKFRRIEQTERRSRHVVVVLTVSATELRVDGRHGGTGQD
jgi:hypothetical protein